MKDQHKLIKGYRDLSQEEIDLMNRIKIAEAQVLDLGRDVREHLSNQMACASEAEVTRIADASPIRWHSIALTHLEQGFMALVRSVAQPAPARLEKTDE